MDAYVVTGGGRGIGRAVVEQLTAAGPVIVVELDPAALDGLPAGVEGVVGDAGDEAVLERVADRAERCGRLVGWVNNAAVFRDRSVHDTPATEVLELIAANLRPPLAGCTVAVRRFLAAGTPARSSTCPPTRPYGRCPGACRTPPRRPPAKA